MINQHWFRKYLMPHMQHVIAWINDNLVHHICMSLCVIYCRKYCNDKTDFQLRKYSAILSIPDKPYISGIALHQRHYNHSELFCDRKHSLHFRYQSLQSLYYEAMIFNYCDLGSCSASQFIQLFFYFHRHARHISKCLHRYYAGVPVAVWLLSDQMPSKFLWNLFVC